MDERKRKRSRMKKEALKKEENRKNQAKGKS